MNAKKRLLFIITKSVWGGAGKYVFDLATNLPKEKFEIAAAMGGRRTLWQKLEKENIKLCQISHFKRNIGFFSDIISFFQVLKVLRSFRPDIIHVNSSKAGGIAGAAFWLYKIPLAKNRRPKAVFTAHGWAFAEKRPRWHIFLIKFLSKITALFYDKIICVSEYDRKTAVENKIAPERKLITVHNGIRPLAFLSRPDAQKKLLGKTSPLVVGAIAEWTKNKGLFYFLEAAKNKNFDVVLIGGGENPDKEKIKDYVKKHNLKNIHLHEFIPNAASYLKGFDIFVLPSLKEGLPYVLLEAGLAELPVVAAKVGGVPEIIEDKKTGLLVEPQNSKEISSAIEILIKDAELRANLGSNLRKKVIEEFSFEKTLNQTEEILLARL